MDDSLFAFPDTNVFLHYKPLAQIDWCTRLNARSVTLVICLPVIQELDEKKSDPRLADRARRAIKDIEEHYSGAKPLRACVSLEIYNQELRRDEFPSSLSPDSQDDRIVHLVKKYTEDNSDRNMCVLTEDFGMVLRCRVGGVACHRMDESDRLENPGEEKDKKLKQLQGELASLKNRLPKMSVRIFPQGQTPGENESFRCTLTDDWEELDAQVEVQKQRKVHPKHADRTPPRFGSPITGLFEAHVSPERWERYDRELEDYFSTYESYVDRLNIWGANNARTVRFSVLLENSGTSPATDLDLFLVFPTKVRWLAEQSSREAAALQKPSPPPPPERPSPDFVTAMFPLRGFGSLLSPTIPALRDIALRPDPDEPEVRIAIRPDQGHLIHSMLRKLKHGEGIVLGNFLALFGAWADVSPFEVEYSISASEHPEKITGCIPMIVNRAEPGGPGRGGAAGESAGS